MTGYQVPAACTLPTAERPLRLAEFDEPMTSPTHPTATAPGPPPLRSRVTGALAAIACAACCALPPLIAAGVVTGAGAAILEKALLAVAAALATAALGMWWSHRRRAVRRAAHAGCRTAGCDC